MGKVTDFLKRRGVYCILSTHTHTHIQNRTLFSNQKEWNNAICSNMNGSRDYHTRWNKLEKDKYHMILLKAKKMIQMNLFTKQKQTHRPRKQIYGYQNGKGGGDNLRAWD